MRAAVFGDCGAAPGVEREPEVEPEPARGAERTGERERLGQGDAVGARGVTDNAVDALVALDGQVKRWLVVPGQREDAGLDRCADLERVARVVNLNGIG